MNMNINHMDELRRALDVLAYAKSCQILKDFIFDVNPDMDELDEIMERTIEDATRHYLGNDWKDDMIEILVDAIWHTHDNGPDWLNYNGYVDLEDE